MAYFVLNFRGKFSHSFALKSIYDKNQFLVVGQHTHIGVLKRECQSRRKTNYQLDKLRAVWFAKGGTLKLSQVILTAIGPYSWPHWYAGKKS